MMRGALKRKHKRLIFVAVGFALVGLAATLILSAFEENIVLFHSPTDVANKAPNSNEKFRLGGLVELGSLKKGDDTLIKFNVTDGIKSVSVTFNGILPDLFRENQGVVAEGKMISGVFYAEEILAKHDENYMPPEVADAIKKAGKWKNNE